MYLSCLAAPRFSSEVLKFRSSEHLPVHRKGCDQRSSAIRLAVFRMQELIEVLRASELRCIVSHGNLLVTLGAHAQDVPSTLLGQASKESGTMLQTSSWTCTAASVPRAAQHHWCSRAHAAVCRGLAQRFPDLTLSQLQARTQASLLGGSPAGLQPRPFTVLMQGQPGTPTAMMQGLAGGPQDASLAAMYAAGFPGAAAGQQRPQGSSPQLAPGQPQGLSKAMLSQLQYHLPLGEPPNPRPRTAQKELQ